MQDGYIIEVRDGDLRAAIRGFLESILARDSIHALLTPARLPDRNLVSPVLFSDPRHLTHADPLSPAFPLNGARLVSRLTRQSTGGPIAVVLRPCEIRAFSELVKLKQGTREDLLIIGLDCLGALTNEAFQAAAEDGQDLTGRFCRDVLSHPEGPETFELASACKVCEHLIPETADVMIGLYGLEERGKLWCRAGTPAGAEVLKGLGLPAGNAPAERGRVVEELVRQRVAERDEMFARTRAETGDLRKLNAYLAACVNCYNCRVACPVCYCRECVFSTDVFDYEPAQYLRWADRKGAVKMPTDTVFYHLTRMAHISTTCVGCGQCSNACPNDIPLMELFRTVSHRIQQSFDYEPGRNIDEPPPLAVFEENELSEVVGI